MLALIVEDERLSAERLAHQVNKLQADIEIAGIVGSVDEARSWFRDNSPPDLVFMDIQLSDGTAFDLLAETTIESPIIFTTAYDEYAIKAFEFNSIDYLLKPIELSKLKSAVEKLQRVSPNQNSFSKTEDLAALQRVITGEFKKRFLVKIGDQFIPVNSTDIHYFCYDKGSSWIVTLDGKKYLVEHSLDQIENLINPLDFFRINRQFIVTLKAISEIHTYFNSRLLIRLVPEWKEEVIVSRDRVSDFKRWMDL